MSERQLEALRQLGLEGIRLNEIDLEPFPVWSSTIARMHLAAWTGDQARMVLRRMGDVRLQ